MACIIPLTCIRPRPDLASKMATGPHSALSREEIAAKIRRNPLTYSRIVHPKELWGDDKNVYRKAAAQLQEWLSEGIMCTDTEPGYYLYRLRGGTHQQTGLVCRTPIDEIIEGRIHAHETIRENKLRDLASHIEICGAQIGGPILMAYRARQSLSERIARLCTAEPLYSFTSENGIFNQIWKVTDAKEVEALTREMAQIGDLYIADGHHRVMAAVEICRKRRSMGHYTGQEPWNYLACVCFEDEELQILPYARMVKDRKGLSFREFTRMLADSFDVAPAGEQVYPSERGEFLLYTEGTWLRLNVKKGVRPETAPDFLDVAVLQRELLEKVLGIGDPRSDRRLDFVGGTNQREAILGSCRRREQVGILLYPTSMEEVFAVADADATMPPKSTWFEPKLCNGLFLYEINAVK
ncbi:MAG: DUF1015 domain-containing protein [Lachnospiraceae bacterium]|nr:DUF1015 domain-containing protein [Lachnospiraceae bacterium]